MNWFCRNKRKKRGLLCRPRFQTQTRTGAKAPSIYVVYVRRRMPTQTVAKRRLLARGEVEKIGVADF